VAVRGRVEDVHGSRVEVAHAAPTADARCDDAWVRGRRTVRQDEARLIVGVARVVRVGIAGVGIAGVGFVGVGFVGVGIAGVALASSLARGPRRVRRVTAGEAAAGADVTPGVKMTASAERRSGVAYDVFIPDRVAATAEPRDQEERMWARQPSDFPTGRSSRKVI
jgi:hypothetical protein